MRRYAALVVLSALGYVIAFATQLVISHRFGATAELDAYWAALALVNFLAFYAHPIREAVVPQYHRLLGQQGNEKDRYLSRVAVLLLLPSLVGSLVALGFSVPLARLVVSDELQVARAAELLRTLAPGVVLFAVSELLAGLLVPFHRIVAQAAIRLLAAGTMLGSVLLLTDHWGARGIAAGFLAMQAAAIVAQVALLARAGARLASPFGTALGAGPRSVLKALLITYLFSQAYAVLEKEVFVSLRPGLASAYQYAIALVNTLLSIFGATLTALLWPRLLDSVRDRAHGTTLALTGLGLQAVLLILAPLCTFLFLMAEPVVLLIYARGAFDASAASLTSSALRAAVFGAIPVAAASVLIRLMVSTQSASSLARVGIGIAVSGMIVLLAARLAASEALGILHWPLANLVGMAAALAAFAAHFSLPRSTLAAALRWSGRLALACFAVAALLAFWPVVREGLLLRALDLALAFLAAMTLYAGVVWALRLLPPPLAKAPFPPMKIPEYSDEARQLARIVAPLSRSSRILDVGCGTGRNLELLQTLGFTRVRGVDLNPALVAASRARGLDCVTVQQLEQEPPKPDYDALLMSHVIEHFEHTRLLEFIESYLKRLRPGGALLVVTPLPNRIFYNDFDHVRPYLPPGLRLVFGAELAQVQFQAGAVLELEDIRFYRDQFRLQFYRRFFVRQANPLPLWLNRVFKLLFFLSRGAIGTRMGWIGRYRYIGRRNGP